MAFLLIFICLLLLFSVALIDFDFEIVWFVLFVNVSFMFDAAADDDIDEGIC